MGLAGCGVELEHGLDERQANQIAALLDQAGIRADKQGQDDAFTIVVPRAELARAVQTLEARDLPRSRIKAPSASSLLPSPLEEKTRLAASEAARLEATLEILPQVSVARVHLALPPEELLPGDQPRVRPTASVLLKAHGDVPIAEVQRLVARAVPSMQPADVA